MVVAPVGDPEFGIPGVQGGLVVSVRTLELIVGQTVDDGHGLLPGIQTCNAVPLVADRAQGQFHLQVVLEFADPGDGEDQVLPLVHLRVVEADLHLGRHVVVRHLHGQRGGAHDLVPRLSGHGEGQRAVGYVPVVVRGR